MPKVIVILGPTASGKTEFSVKLAELINAEIISADSRQIYKDISIATCSPSHEYRKKIKHHFIEELSLNEEYNAGIFAQEARNKINELLSKGVNVIITGGSGLYIKALIDGFFELKIHDTEIKENLFEIMNKYGKLYLFKKLQDVDPESAAKMDYTKYRRVIRALEVYYSTGNRISDLQKLNIPAVFTADQWGLLWKREILYKRINSRVDRMISLGLIDEIKKLIKNNYHYSTNNSLNTVGIKEVIQYLEGKCSYDEMLNNIKQNTRNYAKRQMTWFRKDKRIEWIHLDENSDISGIVYKLHNIL